MSVTYCHNTLHRTTPELSVWVAHVPVVRQHWGIRVPTSCATSWPRTFSQWQQRTSPRVRTCPTLQSCVLGQHKASPRVKGEALQRGRAGGPGQRGADGAPRWSTLPLHKVCFAPIPPPSRLFQHLPLAPCSPAPTPAGTGVKESWSHCISEAQHGATPRGAHWEGPDSMCSAVWA